MTPRTGLSTLAYSAPHIQDSESLAATENRPFAIKTSNLFKTYRNGGKVVDALGGVELAVERGEFIGVLGPNGAGKTSLIEILEGIRQPDQGEVEVLGTKVQDQKAMQKVRARIGIALQHSVLPPLTTVAELLSFQRGLYDSKVDPEMIMDLVGLSDQRAKRVGGLSGGQQQRVAIAMALMGDPDLMFLDEPTSQLDPHARLALWEILYAQRNRRNTSVLITTHQMEEAQRICDRVLIIDKGKIIAEGAPNDLIRRHFRHRRVYFVTAGDVQIETSQSDHQVIQLRDGRAQHQILSSAPLEMLAEMSARYGDKLTEVSIAEPTLEDLFLKLTPHAARRVQ
ncbi:ABC transporter ATP-binding protein [Paracoccus aminophilus]|uniref:ABC-type multidrug transport system, ATPase component n=1 Tax=Paracoccus aminophilus JCM 7686 TaxID=1367847 RepID=S5Y067_PARAH|nr:ABC transporter ATP-binding protein [Paracoccus aminophilus]AGT10937.1 ABC-type multidrug transport system, ATPase component [Paracoccus aminophilus JCM 7686]